MAWQKIQDGFTGIIFAPSYDPLAIRSDTACDIEATDRERTGGAFHKKSVLLHQIWRAERTPLELAPKRATRPREKGEVT